jgi:hypothetical protein
MAFKTIEELTWTFVRVDDGVVVRRQLDKQVLSNHGGWCSVLYLYQNRMPENYKKPNQPPGNWMAPQAVLVRYQRVKGLLRMRKQISIAMTYADKLGATLMIWNRALHDRLPMARCNSCHTLYIDGQGKCKCEVELRPTG